MKVSCTVLLMFLVLGMNAQQEHRSKIDTTTVRMLDEVVLTATRTEKNTSDLPIPVQVIGEKQIKTINSLRLSDIINEQTGLITVPDFGAGLGVQMQGLDSQYVLILIDGVPVVGRSAGTLDLSRITLSNVKKIEIVKGASSSLYGSEALGGVINIITESKSEGIKGINGSIKHRVATFNTHDSSGSVNGGGSKIAWNTFVNRYSSEGYNITNASVPTVLPFYNYTTSSQLLYQISKKTNAKIFGRYYIQNQNNRDELANKEMVSGKSNIQEWNATLKLNHHWNTSVNSSVEVLSTNYKTNQNLNFANGLLFDASYFNQHLHQGEFRTNYQINKKNAIITGLGLRLETLDRTYFTFTPKINAQFFYLQYDAVDLLPKLNLISGFRYDRNEQFTSQFSPKIALKYEFVKNLSIKSSVGYGYKAPDFRQLYFDFTNSTVGYSVLGYNIAKQRLTEMQQAGQLNTLTVSLNSFNESLQPESSINYNFGLNYLFPKGHSFEINFFRNDINHLIDTRVVASKTNGQNTYSYYNVNKVFTQGFEINTKLKAHKNITITTGYQYLIAKDKQVIEQFKNGKVFARDASLQSFQLKENDYIGLYNRSKNMFNFKLFYEIPKWNLNTNFRLIYRDKYGITDSNSNGYLDVYDNLVKGYFLLNYAINKTFSNKITMGLATENLLNYTDKNIPNLPGRLLIGSISYQF